MPILKLSTSTDIGENANQPTLTEHSGEFIAFISTATFGVGDGLRELFSDSVPNSGRKRLLQHFG